MSFSPLAVVPQATLDAMFGLSKEGYTPAEAEKFIAGRKIDPRVPGVIIPAKGGGYFLYENPDFLALDWGDENAVRKHIADLEMRLCVMQMAEQSQPEAAA